MKEDRRCLGQVSAQTAIGRREVLPPPFEKSKWGVGGLGFKNPPQKKRGGGGGARLRNAPGRLGQEGTHSYAPQVGWAGGLAAGLPRLWPKCQAAACIAGW